MMRYCTSGVCGDGRQEKAIIDLSRLRPRIGKMLEWGPLVKNCQNVFPLDNY